MEVPLEHVNHDTFTAEKYVRWPGATSPSVLGLPQISGFLLRVPTQARSRKRLGPSQCRRLPETELPTEICCQGRCSAAVN